VADELADERRSYERGRLDAADLSPQQRADPLVVLAGWIDEARDAGALEPTAMVLSTVDEHGPDARVVLCKGLDHGVVWFTNHTSAKGRQLSGDGRAAVTFHWESLERQVRVRGRATRLTPDEDDAYFATRPRTSQLGAWASGTQSAPVDDRTTLEAELAAVAARFKGGTVPRPDHWGGWRLEPTAVELWQGRPGRLHDRLRFTRDPVDRDGAWTLVRLRP
jgi:pyridoxamine 5'-phosphate oxidase